MTKIGGVSRKDVVNFQLKLMMGSQYDRVINAKEEKDIIIACLRMAWNDAFRHVSANVYNSNNTSDRDAVLGIYGVDDVNSARITANRELGLPENNTDDNLIVSEHICQKILGSDIVYNTFLTYASKKTTKDKIDVINNAIDAQGIRNAFSSIKIIDDKDYPLCFGHFQKMFNMAMKLYLCIYSIKLEKIIKISAPMGKEITKEMLKNADCPIDSIILKALDELDDKNEEHKKIEDIHPYVKTRKTKKIQTTVAFSRFEDIKWSKFGKFDLPNSTSERNELTFTCEHYENIQKVIRQYVPEGHSNLYFDFKNWK